MAVIDFFKNSAFFDRATDGSKTVLIQTIERVKDNTGTYIETITKTEEELNSFITPVKRSLIPFAYLEKYDEANYVYLSRELLLKDDLKTDRIVINNEIMKVIDYNGHFLDSGFYKYMVVGTGTYVEV